MEVRRRCGVGLRRWAVAGGTGSVAAGYASAGCVTNARVLRELIDATCAAPRDAVLGEQLLQLTVLFGKGIFVSRDAAEVLFQS